jgi:hypothetical protein
VTANAIPGRTEPVHRSFAAACRATWAGAPVVVGVSVVWVLAAVPVLVAGVAGLPVPLVALTLPFLVVTTGVVRVLAAVASERPVNWRQLASIDPVLALTAWGIAIAIERLLAMGDVDVVVACALGALGMLVMPLAFAYGATRDRRGIAAVRGGLVLAIVHPDLALTVAAMAVLAAFAVVVSAGALALCVPALVAVYACKGVAADLHRFGVTAE